MSELRDVTTAVLVGGRGTRLRPVTGPRPKVLAPVHGRPYLTFILDRLADAGAGEVVLLTGYRADEVRAALGAEHRGVRLVYSAEPSPLGTGGAVRLALERFTGRDVLLLNGDSYCDVDLAAFQEFHRDERAELSLVLARVEDTSRFGTVELAGGDRVARYGEKEAGGGAGWINAGVYLLRPGLVAEIPAGRAVSLEREMIPGWIGGGRRVFGYPGAGRFIDIGTPEAYAAAADFFTASEPGASATGRGAGR